MPIILNNGHLLEGDAGTASKIDYWVSGLDGTTLIRLASGQLADAKATLYTASGTDTIACIDFFNTHTSAMAVNFYANDGSSRQIIGIDSFGAGYHGQFDGTTLRIQDNNGKSYMISTDVDINSGTIDGVTIGGAVAPTVTDLGTVTTCDIDGGTIDGVTIGGAAAPTVTDLGSVATCDINGGTIAGVTVDGAVTMAENCPIALDAALSADEKYSGITRAGTAGAILAVGDLVYYAVADGKWELADADAAATTQGTLGICVLAAAEDAATTILLIGMVRSAAFPAFTAGAPVFVGTTTGDVQVAAPTGSGDCIRCVGQAWTAEELWFCPSPDWFEHA